MVERKVKLAVPTVSEVVTTPASLAELVWRTQTLVLLAMVPVVVVKVPVQPIE